MVGKLIRQRRRLHQAAPKLPKPGGQWPGEATLSEARGSVAGKDQALFTSNIFAGVKIDPKSLVKKLDTDSGSIISVRKDEDEKTVLSKKEKKKLRRDKWLQKIESIKLAKQQQKAEAKRKSTPVVGDLHPLIDALPELSDLVKFSKTCKQSKVQVKNTTLTNFHQMKSVQKRKVLEEEVAQFHRTISNPLFKASPLAVVGEHLSKKLKQERVAKPF
uniref:SLX9 ribosome biosis factor n=1 Tax=Salvator merianae TaxID=96440 RepID=A0A8D0E6Z5_SALMN